MVEKPVVYILHGDDEFAMDEFIATLEDKMGDPATASMNITRLEGGAYSLEALVANTHALPFLTDRRLVVLTDPLAGLSNPSIRQKFMAFLEEIPSTTALVLAIHRPLQTEKEKREKIWHWLQQWAATQGGRVYLREFSPLHGSQMERWILDRAAELGGAFSYQAAVRLAEYTLEDPRLATQEIHKLLTYANYSRPVEVEDVERLTPYAGEGNVFEMVDALGNRNGQLALKILHHLLEEEEPGHLFFMIVRQFRLLLQTREMLNSGYREAEIARQLKTPLFVVRKLVPQASHFSIPGLENIMRQLLDIDQAIKTSQVEWQVALDTLITSLTI